MSYSTVFTRQVRRAKTKATQVPLHTLQLIQKTNLNSFHSHYTLFESVIKPTLLYAAGVWAYQYRKELEAVQNNYYRRILSLSPTLSTSILRKEVASKPFEVSLWTQTINFLIKIRNMPANRYSFIIYNHLLQLDENERNEELRRKKMAYNWVTKIRVGLLPLGLDGVVTMLPENLRENYEEIVRIIEKPFADHDDYIMKYHQVYPQYQMLINSETRKVELGTNAAANSDKVTRWNILPW